MGCLSGGSVAGTYCWCGGSLWLMMNLHWSMTWLIVDLQGETLFAFFILATKMFSQCGCFYLLSTVCGNGYGVIMPKILLTLWLHTTKLYCPAAQPSLNGRFLVFWWHTAARDLSFAVIPLVSPSSGGLLWRICINEWCDWLIYIREPCSNFLK